MRTKLDQIAERARKDRRMRFTSLAHLVTPEFLRETWSQVNKRGAAGVDGETIMVFEEDLAKRVQDLHQRAKSGSYRPPPVRRVEIPKGDGKVRALGIPTVEDRLLQAAVARVLSAVFEEDFLEVSFGYRRGRSAHDALRTLQRHLIVGKIMHIHEADIASYFDKVNHAWLRRMLAERIADRSLLRLIDRWLRAGVMDGGVALRSSQGVPQGGPISPVLAKIYLHYALDLWFERMVKKHCQGNAELVRFADDYVACFQYRKDAMRYETSLHRRMAKFGLRLSEAKTRLLYFGRFAKQSLARLGRKPEEFVFLGFRHICGTDRSGKYAVIRLPAERVLRRFRDRVRTWLMEHMHWRVRDQQRQLSRMLRGFYAYFALPHCGTKLSVILMDVQRQWRKILRRRSQRGRTHWSYLRQQAWFKLPAPTILHRFV